MATGTAATSPATRENHQQVVNYIKKVVNYNDAGISSGVAFDQAVPKGAFILGVWVEIITAFDAGTTNVLTAGFNSSSFNDLVAAGDVDEAALATTQVLRGAGRSLASDADKVPYAKYTQTGDAATAGKAEIVIAYTGGESVDGF